jgi:probable O-glycosylation ligase (exosortase A-associated)
LELSDKDRKVGTFLAYSYIFFYYVRPQEYIPGLNSIPTSGVLFLLTSIWGWFHFRSHIFKTPIGFIFLIGVLLFLSGIDAVNVSSYKISFKYIVELFPQCITLFLIFNTKERIVSLIKFWWLIYFLMSLITIYNGGLGPGDFTNDPNDASLALTMGLPWCIYSIRFLDITKWQKLFCIITSLILILAIVKTGSRGGFLGLVAMLLVLWWFSEKRTRNAVYSFMVLLALSTTVISMLPDNYIEEMQSINDTEDSTRVERIRTWEVAWIMFKDNPIVGVGGNNFPYNAGYYQRETSWWTGNEKSLNGRFTHSVYFQILSELGILGSLTYLFIFLSLPLRLHKFRKRQRSSPQIYDKLDEMFSLTLMLSMVAYLISGAFISVAYYPHIPIWLTMYAILIRYRSQITEENL